MSEAEELAELKEKIRTLNAFLRRWLDNTEEQLVMLGGITGDLMDLRGSEDAASEVQQMPRSNVHVERQEREKWKVERTA